MSRTHCHREPHKGFYPKRIGKKNWLACHSPNGIRWLKRHVKRLGRRNGKGEVASRLDDYSSYQNDVLEGISIDREDLDYESEVMFSSADPAELFNSILVIR